MKAKSPFFFRSSIPSVKRDGRAMPEIRAKHGLATFVVSFLVLAFGATALVFGHAHISLYLHKRAAKDVTDHIEPYVHALDETIHARLVLLDGLEAFVRLYPTTQDVRGDFDTFAHGLYVGNSGIQAIQVYPPEGKVLVYPLHGNESIADRELADLVEDTRPDVREDVRRAVETGTVSLSAPYVLIQGGYGLVGRLAVRKDGRFWGLANLVLDIEALFAGIGFQTPSFDLDVGLRDRTGGPFWGDVSVWEREPVIREIALFDHVWEIGAVPRDGWQSESRDMLALFLGAGSLATIILASFFFMLMSRARSLELAVRQKTESLRSAGEDLERALSEKNTLLHEVHHRIKNNMSTMMSLLSLQAEAARDADVAAALRDAMGRLSSMNVLYNRLYVSDNLVEMALFDYLGPLAREIVGAFPAWFRVRLDVPSGGPVMSVKQLANMGILVNELVSNTMKYALAERESVVIAMRGRELDGRLEFAYFDDGDGVPEGLELESSAGFGFKLLLALASQMRGSVALERGSGARFTFDIEIDKLDRSSTQ